MPMLKNGTRNLARTAFATLLAVGAAHAQCGFDHSLKAKSLKMSLVRAMSACTAPDTTTTGGMSACSAPAPQSVYRFADGGGCDVRVLHKPTATCQLAASCSELTLSAKCSGLLDESDVPAANDGWKLRIVLSMSATDPSYGDMTLIDVPIEILFPAASAGKFAMKTAMTTFSVLWLGPYSLADCVSAGLVAETTAGTIGAAIVDPDGSVFAVPGTAGSVVSANGCTIDLPKKSGVKAGLVRAFARCPASEEFPYPNSVTGDGLASCIPVYPWSQYRFATNGGSCRFTLRQVASTCDPPCAPLRVDLKCQGIALANGITRIDESGWSLRLTMRVMAKDQAAGNVTLADVPAVIPLPAISSGKLKARIEVPELAEGWPPTSSLYLDGCTSLQLVDAQVLDSAGNEFARLGTATFPR